MGYTSTGAPGMGGGYGPAAGAVGGYGPTGAADYGRTADYGRADFGARTDYGNRATVTKDVCLASKVCDSAPLSRVALSTFCFQQMWNKLEEYFIIHPLVA